MKTSIWNSPLLNSRAPKTKVGLWEMALGYFLGPLFVLAMTTIVSTYYLTFYRTYDDVVAQGRFLVLLPLLSVIPMALGNILVGILLGKTKTRQGKARPFILAAGPMLAVSGMVMFIIPYFSLGFRMVWMAVTFNLFAALANPVYGSAHFLMVSLSTRDLKQRSLLSVVANIPAVAGNGLFSSILMPMILSWINSAPANDVLQNRWQLVMGLFSAIAFVGCLIEYLFTRERITEEDLDDDAGAQDTGPSTLVQLKSAASDRYWWIIMVFYFFYQMGVMFKGGYVFNIFTHTYFENASFFGIPLNGDTTQSLLALIGGVPLAAGMLFISPLANRFGKKNMILVGFVISIIGSLVSLIDPSNLTIVLIGQILKGISSIPGAYIMMALFADVLDHLEARFGFRVDGISMSVYNTIITVVNGLAVAVFNLFYDNAALSHEGVVSFFFLGFEIFAHGILFVLMLFMTVEKNIRQEQDLIAQRKAGAQ